MKTVKAKVPLTGKMAVLVMSMTGMLDVRMAFRFSIIMAGMMLADDRCQWALKTSHYES